MQLNNENKAILFNMSHTQLKISAILIRLILINCTAYSVTTKSQPIIVMFHVEHLFFKKWFQIKDKKARFGKKMTKILTLY